MPGVTVIVTIEWQDREDGKKPLNSDMPNTLVKVHCPV